MSTSERINGFDALRTIAMWLGIVLHSIIAYKSVPEIGWPVDNRFNLGFLDWMYAYIHIFRMPVFFLVAGFFARLVIMRSGINYFVTQRFKRILIPFVIGTILLVPLTMIPFHFYKLYNANSLSSYESWKETFSLLFSWNGLAHLWFLYYLLIIYGINLILLFIGGTVRADRESSFKIKNISLLKLALSTLLLYVILYFNKAAVPPVYTGLKPQLFHVLYYGFFYTCGWLIHTNIKSIYSLQKTAFFLFIIGTVLSVFIFYRGSTLPTALALLIAAVETIALVAGLIGLLMKYFHKESRAWRYCSDAAYWVYLIHMGIVAALQVGFLNSNVTPLLRLPLVLAITFILCLLTYQFFVRYTVVGNYLHGKRKRPEKEAENRGKKKLSLFVKKL
jgi:glucan biosynthesis protein C